ncbi:alpha/beta hydrolase [uncultured Acetobacteroides sp.]|uniref:alpha/beta fold hydrolase n=1 Tax=uncultured Acetobacteroides sp. TaxID=1760811 RepID=UPI0029F4B625|nr:alpha/beta hydrolase [uncultured Acetobacteroides sp.]
MKPVAEALSADFGILEPFQTKASIDGQIEELRQQLISNADLPAVLIGHSWGAWLVFLFASRYPALVKKLILVGSGSFENKYNQNLMEIRVQRLNKGDRADAEALMVQLSNENSDVKVLERFGKLMTMADSYDYLPDLDCSVVLNLAIHTSVWKEAAQLRDTGELVGCASKIKCPVVAFHGDYDSHPMVGVEQPLSERLSDFKMVKLAKCGHTPWNEKYAREEFFRLLKFELE